MTLYARPCSIAYYNVPSGPYGASEARAHCATHNHAVPPGHSQCTGQQLEQHIIDQLNTVLSPRVIQFLQNIDKITEGEIPR